METTKTTEKFKSVHQTFSYTPPSAWTNQMVKPGIWDRYDRRTFDLPFWVTYQAGGHPLSSSLFHDFDYWRCTTAYHDIL